MNECSWIPLAAFGAVVALVVFFTGLFQLADYVNDRHNFGGGYVVLVGGLFVAFAILAIIVRL